MSLSLHVILPLARFACQLLHFFCGVTLEAFEVAKTEDWRAERLAFLRGLSKPSDAQRMLLSLVELPERSAKQMRELETLWRLERINERAESVRVKAYRIVNAKRSTDRKARDRRLIQLGALAEMAGLDVDRGLALGAFLYAAEHLQGDRGQVLTAEFKWRGDAMLKEREKVRKTRTAPAEKKMPAKIIGV
jgi:hypothetical protein